MTRTTLFRFTACCLAWLWLAGPVSAQPGPSTASPPSETAPAEDDGWDFEDDDWDFEDEEEDVAQTYRVKVDGEEYDVELDELVKGYQRNADYTQKAQSMAKA